MELIGILALGAHSINNISNQSSSYGLQPPRDITLNETYALGVFVLLAIVFVLFMFKKEMDKEQQQLVTLLTEEK